MMYLQYTVQWQTMAMQGCNDNEEAPMAVDGIDEETGLVDVYALLPEHGDSVMIVNCGDHFEMRKHCWSITGQPPLILTDQDLTFLKQGRITWN